MVLGLFVIRAEAVVLDACARLKALFREQPALRRTLLTHHGVIPTWYLINNGI
jgi:hypothetical protein